MGECFHKQGCSSLYLPSVVCGGVCCSAALQFFPEWLSYDVMCELSPAGGFAGLWALGSRPVDSSTFHRPRPEPPSDLRSG